jgi:mRNA interferase RelE/StbE
MSYRIVILNKAEKDIEKIHSTLVRQVFRKIYALAENPRPTGCKKLTNYQSDRLDKREFYRIRIGDIY